MSAGRADDQQSLELGDVPAPSPPARPEPVAGRIVRVLPDVSGLDREFDYVVPTDALIAIGSMVRVDLHGRRVAGWVTAVDVDPPPGVALRPVSKVSGVGPPADLIELATWASRRWAGRRARLLSAASPPTMVADVGPPVDPQPAPGPLLALADEAFDRGLALVRLPPAADVVPFAVAATARGHALVVTPTLDAARALALRVRRAGLGVALAPRDWARGAAGATVVGARGAAWMPVGGLAAVLVVDEHDEALQEERVPTWHARDVLVERARRAGVPCVLTSPSPSLAALALAEPMVPSRRAERDGWPVLDIVDRRAEEPRRAGLYSERLVAALRATGGRVVCVLNRTGRSRLLACDGCGELAVCDACARPMSTTDDTTLACAGCGATRPSVCLSCGATRFRNLRAGVTRVREELEALAGRPVVEVSGSGPRPPGLEEAPIVVGTEAVLHAVDRAAVVAFLDIDQELLAPRYRAAEQAMALLVRAARLVGGRDDGGRILVQTRQPRHPVLDAVLHADPGRLVDGERARRSLLRLPPDAAMAEVSGAAGADFVAGLIEREGVQVLGPNDGRWLVKAPDPDALAEVLAGAPRPGGRLRIAVDPPRV